MRRLFLAGFLGALVSLCSLSAKALNLDAFHYAVYEQEVGSGAKNLYVVPRKVFILIHGTPSTPLVFIPDVTGYLIAVSSDGSLSDPVAVAVNAEELEALGGYTRSGYRFFEADLTGDGVDDLLLQGVGDDHSFVLVDNGTKANPLPDIYHDFGTVLDQDAVSIVVRDINNDGENDVLVTDSDGYQYGYTHGGMTFASTDPDYSLVATINGQFRVSEQGGATYNVPVKVAPGTAGVAPQLSLNYSSRGGNGIAGVGWSLGGLSSITRCRQTLAQDGAPLPITLTDQDRFCIDGQRLILISGNYGQTGSVYRTEIDSFAVIEAHGGSSGNPAYFTVTRKDGSTTYYGNGNGSTDVVQGINIAWVISRFEDSAGNPIRFSYVNENGDGHRIHRIDYAYGSDKNQSVLGDSETFIRFNYEDRPDVRSGYFNGVLRRQTKLLKSIESFNEGQEFRTLELRYRYFSNPSYLTRIYECVNGECVQPTTFNWNYRERQIEFNYSQYLAVTPGSRDGLLNATPADINGDGRLDYVWMTYQRSGGSGSDFDHRIKYSLSHGSGLGFANFTNGLHYIEYQEQSNEKVRLLVGDYNGDGRSDIFIYGQDRGSWCVYPSVYHQGSWKLSATCHETGINRVTYGSWVPDAQLADVNSDGLVDFVFVGKGPQGEGVYVAYSIRNGNPASSTQAYSYSYPQYKGNSLDFLYHSFEVKKIRGVGDFDGDGNVDIVMQVTSASYNNYEENEYNNVKQGIAIHTSLNAASMELYFSETRDLEDESTSSYCTEYCFYGIDVFTVADINSDGYSDLIVDDRANREYQVWINRGDGDFTKTSLFHYGGSPINNLQVVDVNSDGYPDIVWNNYGIGVLQVRYWQPEQGILSQTMGLAGTSGFSDQGHFLLDIDGSGTPDFITTTTQDMHVRLNARSREGRDVISQINNGLGNITTIAYELLSQTDHYEQISVGGIAQHGFDWEGSSYSKSLGDFYDAINGSWDIDAGEQSMTKEAPTLPFVGPMNVVTSVSSTAPRADSSPGNVDYNAASQIDYYYGEARLQAAGRGLLGFHSVKTVDRQSEVETITKYRQDFPFIGMPLTTTVKSPGGQILKQSHNVYTYAERTGADGTFYYQAYPERVWEESYEPTAGVMTARTVTEQTQDEWGNVEYTKVTTYNGDDLVNYLTEMETDNTFGTTTWEKEKGRLTRSVVTQRRLGDEKTQVALFDYYTSGPQTGLLRSETVEPVNNLPTSTQTYTYDDFGNKLHVTTTTPGQPDRYTRWEYDTVGRYVDRTYTIFSVGERLTEEVVTRNTFGQPTQINGLNGIITHIEYDDIGRESYRYDNTGAWVDTEVLTDQLVTGAQFRVVTTVAGGGSSSEHFDALGRSIAKAKVGFDGGNVWSFTEYDSSGRVKYQSTPHYINESIYWAESVYDSFGRVEQLIAPDGIITGVSYTGRTTTTTRDVGGLNQTKQETRDASGQLVQVTDHIGGTIEYEYTADGQLTRTHVRDSALAETITTEISYDALGRKAKMIDPDKGTWFYEYNGFGELVRQYKVVSTHYYVGTLQQALADSAVQMQRTEITYDMQGRMKTRYDYLETGAQEGVFTWNYDTQSNGVGQVSSISGGGKASYFAYDSYGRSSAQLDGLGAAYALYSTVYDDIGRVLEQHDALGTGSGTVNHYNAYGYLESVTDLATDELIYDVQSINARGQTTSVLMGNGHTTQYWYEDTTARLQRILAGNGIAVLQDISYTWDALGNMRSRDDQSAPGGTPYNQRQSFCYDGLNRLIKTHANTTTGSCAGLTPASQDQRYDDFGNITFKVAVGEYSYGTATQRPHAVQSTVLNGATRNYVYDHTGNMVSDSTGRTFKYRTFDKPYEMTANGAKTEFWYGADRSRYKRVDTQISSGQANTTYYLGNVEKVVKADGTYEMKRYLGGYALWVHQYDAAGNETGVKKQYLYKDALGSTHLVTDGTGTPLDPMAFNPWGERVSSSSWTFNFQSYLVGYWNVSQLLTTSRGFTGHEGVDSIGVIHMNGRIYDPRLGRFLQADIQVDGVTFTQGFNRYSYGHNNPLSGVDPSGYGFFTEVFDDFLGVTENDVLNGIFQIALAYFTAGLGNAVYAGTQTYEYGGTFGQALMSGIIAGVSSYAFSQIGGDWWQAGLVGGVIGGVTAELQGGKFGHGFISAGIGAAFGASNVFTGAGQAPIRFVAAAVVGGTASKLSGGKFANGAATGAFAFVVSDFLNAEELENSKTGTLDFDSEGSAADRKARFKQAVSELSVDDAKFIDEYRITTIDKNTLEKVGTDLFASSASQAKKLISNAPAGTARGFVNGMEIRNGGFLGFFQKSQIIIYRTGVMGFTGSVAGTKYFGYVSAIDNARIVLGHEYAHRIGLDRSGPYAQAHENANKHGIFMCKQAGGCSAF